MVFQVFIRHKVSNFRKWKAVFEAHGPARLAQGCEGTHVFRRADNPKELVVMLTWGDLGKARQFLVSDDLQEMLAETPVCDRAPDVYLLEELEQTCRSASPDQHPNVVGDPSHAILERLTASPAPRLHESPARPPEESTLANPDWTR